MKNLIFVKWLVKTMTSEIYKQSSVNTWNHSFFTKFTKGNIFALYKKKAAG